MSNRRSRLAGSGLNKQAVDCIAMIRDAYSTLVQDTTLEEIVSEELNVSTNCSLVSKPTIIFFKIPEGQADTDEAFKGYFYAAFQELISTPQDALTIYVNIMRLVFSNLDQKMKDALTNSGMAVKQGSEEDMITWLGLMTGGKAGTEEYTSIKCEPHHYRILIGICFNLITKRLTPQNNDQWLKRRRAAYAIACLGNENDETLIMMTPSLSFSTSTNSAFAACFRLKTLIFNAVRATSKEPSNTLCQCAITTMVYFNMAELTGFYMVYEWLLIRNQCLLGWNGLAKHLPYLFSALTLFRKTGSDAPYCKFLYPPEQLVPFQYSRINIFVVVAYRICKLEGKSSFQNYNGLSDADLPAPLSKKIEDLVNLYGGAKTKMVEGIRRELLFDPKERTKLMDELNRGLEDSGDEEDDAPDDVN